MKKIFLAFIAILLLASPSLALEKNLKNSNIKNEFKPYTKELNYQKLSSDTLEDQDIKIVRNKYKLKYRTANKANGYEYLIKNKSSKPIALKEMGATDVMYYSTIQKKMFLIEPVDLIIGYGTYRDIKSIIQNKRFTKPFPFDYVINPNDNIKILVLSDIYKTPTVSFKFIVNNGEKTILFGTNKNNYDKKDYYKSQISSYNLPYSTNGMLRCILKGNANLVKAYIESGMDINKKFMGNSLLNLAIKKQRTQVVKYFINAGAKIDEKSIKYAKKSKDKHIKDLVLSKSE